jgi:hypothetical protein
MIFSRKILFRRFPGLLFALGLFAVSSCDMLNQITPDPGYLKAPNDRPIPGAPEKRTFLAYSWETGGYYFCDSFLLAKSEHCLVYSEKNGKTYGGLAPDAALGERIADEFDKNIYSPMIDFFGAPLDVDGNGRTILLLLDIKDGAGKDGATSYIAGYFDGTDMELRDDSNKADMIYIDTYPGRPGDFSSYKTIAHEFQHLINYSFRRGRRKPAMDIWIDEGLSSAAEYLYGGPLESRIEWYNNDKNRSILYGNNFFVWDGYWEADPGPRDREIAADALTNYTTVYLFFQWLRIHASNGEKIYQDIINAETGDYRAVTGAAALRIDPRFSDWDRLLSGWYTANRLRQAQGYYGYGNAPHFDLQPRSVSFPGPSVFLAPGEGVFSRLAALVSPGPGGPHIQYAGIDPAAGSPAAGFPLARDLDLLTYNANPSNRAPGREEGYVGSAIPAGRSGSAASRTASEAPVPEPAQWDAARYFLDKRSRKRGP